MQNECLVYLCIENCLTLSQIPTETCSTHTARILSFRLAAVRRERSLLFVSQEGLHYAPSHPDAFDRNRIETCNLPTLVDLTPSYE